VQHWYLSVEQQVGAGLYTSIVGKLMELHEGELGSPFPPADFVTDESAALLKQRAALTESLPSLAPQMSFAPQMRP
jgi:hypothetical protein